MDGMNAMLKLKVRQSATGTPPPPEKPAFVVIATLVLAAAGLFLYTIGS